MNATIITLLKRVELALANIGTRPDLAARLATYGFDAQRLQLGATLHAELSDSATQQVQKRSDRIAATQAYHLALRAAQAHYGRHRRLAHIATNGDGAQRHRLGLHQHFTRTFAPWVTQAEMFYSNALADGELADALATVGIDAVTLETALADIDNLRSLYSVQNDATVAAQEATESRNIAHDALRVWYRELRTIARLVLGSESQVLEAVSQQPVA